MEDEEENWHTKSAMKNAIESEKRRRDKKKKQSQKNQ